MADAGLACNAQWFADASGGSLVKGENLVFSQVDSDSRLCKKASLFVAIKGENSDGHDYASQAINNGATVVLVNSAWWKENGQKLPVNSNAAVIAAEDSIKALQKAATAYRRMFPKLLRIAVSGSSGKTTTKELLAAIFSISRNTVKNPGNLNSDIGLPISIFNIRKEHEVAVFELGINYPGEMDILASVYEPDCALLTNIGTAHIGVLGGSRQKIAMEKAKIASHFDGSQSLIIYEQEDFKDLLLAGLKGRTETFGYNSLPGLVYTKDKGLEGWLINFDGLEIKLKLPGKHNLLNAMAAIKTAVLYGIKPQDIARGLESVNPLEGRSRILKGRFDVIDDCYNANAESVEAAMALCSSVKVEGRHIFVLGSMKELGEESVAAHRRLGNAAMSAQPDLLVFFGEEARDAYNAAMEAAKTTGFKPANPHTPHIAHFESYPELEAFVVSMVRDKDIVLVKASRAMALERLVKQLETSGGLHAS